MGFQQINNINDLQEEISRLRIIENQQSIALVARVNSPSALFSTLLSLFSNKDEGEKQPGIFNQDFFGLLSRIVVPLTLNKTLFKHSNFLVKALVGLVSQKASNYISEDSIGGLWGKVKSLFSKSVKSKSPEVRKGMPAVPPPVVL